MSDPAESPVMHARVPDGQGGVCGPRLPRLHTTVQLTPLTYNVRPVIVSPSK